MARKIGPHNSQQRGFVTTKELEAEGKSRRKLVPRRLQGAWEPPARRADPIELIKAQDRARVPELVPIRYGRMLESPFAFLRGAAIVMANDLRHTAVTGINVQASGDCHVANFGGYATPERNFVFDINDFDETYVAPWEWDVKRLAASIAVAARSYGRSSACAYQAVLATARHYREHMGKLASMTALQAWYSRLEATRLFAEIATSAKQRTKFERGARKVRSRTPEVLLGEMTKRAGRARRFIDHPPFVYHASRSHPHGRIMRNVLERYRKSLRPDVRMLLDRYELVDTAVKVVGVGSVGMRCGIMLLMAEEDDALILQSKEATQSVLQTRPRRAQPNQGERVVTGQRIMQAASDIFLGWTSFEGRDYYVRQLRDMKASVELSLLTGASFVAYAQVCGAILARAHSRSGKAALIRGYLGRNEQFDIALARFAHAYADQTERDYALLKAAVKSGKVKAARIDG